MRKPEAMSAALTYLTFRARSCKEMSDYLHQKGYTDHTVNEVMEELQHQGLLDDMALGRLWVEEWVQQGKGSQRALSDKLYKLGLEREIIATCLQDVDDTHEEDNALQAAQTLAYKYAKLPPLERNRKLSAALARRGFGWDVIKDTVRVVYQDDTDDYE